MSHHTFSHSPQIQPTTAPVPHSTDQHAAARTVSDAEIAKRAYEKYEARGRVDGFDWDDWIAASHELAGDTLSHVGLPSPTQGSRSP